MDEIGYLVKRAQHALRRQIDQSLARLDLTLPQYVALAQLSEEAGLSNAELARRAFVTPQTMHRVVRGLESRGLVTRQAHPHLERVQQLFLTKDGGRLLAKSRRLVAAIEGQGLTDLGTDEVQQLRNLLQRYLTAVEESSI